MLILLLGYDFFVLWVFSDGTILFQCIVSDKKEQVMLKTWVMIFQDATVNVKCQPTAVNVHAAFGTHSSSAILLCIRKKEVSFRGHSSDNAGHVAYANTFQFHLLYKVIKVLKA